ncbi:MAG: gamma-glutamyl-gamma-aminobutyrate hydrolase family protein, partial [Rhizobacter sp.]
LAHDVVVQPGGVLASVLAETRIQVNSVHGQGVNHLASGLRVEALALDGLVEAFSVSDARGFNLCVQWHPEWQAASNVVSVRLFEAFGLACEAFRDRHRVPHQEPEPPDPDR